MTYLNRGNSYLISGNFHEAIADYSQAIEINPNYAKAYDNRGIARSSIGEYDASIADHSKAIGINPSLVDAYLNRAAVYRWNKGDIDKAILDLRQALKIDPTSVAAKHILTKLEEMRERRKTK